MANCASINLTILHQINKNCTAPLGAIHEPVTALLYLVTSILCFFFAAITQQKYNSIEVLNLIVRTKSISNLTWIIYYLFVMFRCVMYSAVYCIDPDDDDPGREVLQGVFIAGWIFKSFETMMLCVSLNYQRKYRSGALIDAEVDRFNKRKKDPVPCKVVAKKVIVSSETVFVCHFLLAVLMLLLTELLNEKVRTGLLFTFVCILWCQSLVALSIACIIITNTNENGPATVTKVLMVIAVIFSLPNCIPNIFWVCSSNQYNDNTCFLHKLITPYDISVFCLMVSVILIFIMMRREYLRLCQESRWAVVGAVQSMFNVDT